MTKLLYLVAIAAAVALATPGAFAMEGDGKQNMPCANINNIDEKLVCRATMVDTRLANLNTRIQAQVDGGIEKTIQISNLQALQDTRMNELKQLFVEKSNATHNTPGYGLINDKIDKKINVLHNGCEKLERLWDRQSGGNPGN